MAPSPAEVPLARAAFPDHETVRSFTVIGPGGLDIVARVAEHLAPLGPHVVKLRAARVAALLECRVCIVGISEERSRDLRAELQGMDGVQRVRLEHRVQFGARPSG